MPRNHGITSVYVDVQYVGWRYNSNDNTSYGSNNNDNDNVYYDDSQYINILIYIVIY